MAKIYTVKFEPLAQAALDEAAAYIREDSGPARAASWLRSMLVSIDKLERLPKAFGIWTRRGGQAIYSKPVPPFRVFYAIEGSTATVHIIDVVHTARETRLAEYRDEPI